MVTRHVGGLTGGRIGGAALAFVWLAFLARHLDLADFADLVLLLSIGSIASVIADAGLPLILNEVVATSPGRAAATLRVVQRRRLVLAVAASVVMSLGYLAVANDRSLLIPLLYAVSLLATARYSSCTAALRGAGWVGPEAVNEVASRLLVLGVGCSLVLRGGGLAAVVASYALADVCSAVVLTVLSSKRLGTDGKEDRSSLAWRRVVPLGLASLAGIMYYRVDVWMLAWLSESPDVARYAVSYRLLDALLVPAGVLAVVNVRSTAALDYESAVARTDRALRVLVVALLPAVVLLELVPATLLSVGFGSSFRDASSVLRILAIAVLPSAAALAWSPLVALRGRRLLVISLGSLGVNLVLNAALIPALGAIGAASATVVGQCGFACMLRLSLARGSR